MHIVLDVLVVAIAVFTIIGAMRRGFVRSLLSLVGLVLSLVLAYSFAVPLGARFQNSRLTPRATIKSCWTCTTATPRPCWRSMTPYPRLRTPR